MLKKLIIFLSLPLIPFLATAQYGIDTNKLKAFLFERFLDGHVLMKSGTVEKAPLNYNSDDQSVYFIKNGIYMVLTGLEEVDTIYLQNKKFVPVRSDLFEIIQDSAGTSVFITYSNKKKPLVATANHAGSSRESSNQVSNTVTSTYVNGIKQNFSSVEIDKHFWIERKKKMYKADNLKQVKLIVPAEARKIENFIKENQINFMLDADILKLAAFLQRLPG